ncbi:MAG: hypothetical protein JJD92_10685 [Frankiaceae bacterium]|nr:hypothetical protein [Frankiaceae bacterium]
MIADLLSAPPVIVNLGLADFVERLRAQAAEVVHVTWSPLQPARARTGRQPSEPAGSSK